jgi:hypothetical protein
MQNKLKLPLDRQELAKKFTPNRTVTVRRKSCKSDQRNGIKRICCRCLQRGKATHIGKPLTSSSETHRGRPTSSTSAIPPPPLLLLLRVCIDPSLSPRQQIKL